MLGASLRMQKKIETPPGNTEASQKSGFEKGEHVRD